MTTENTNDFSKAKVGDRVWVRTMSIEGWGTIINRFPNGVYCLEVDYYALSKGNCCFTAQGQLYKDGPQCLFWDKPEIIAPPRPKRMVKKVVEVRPWVDMNGDIRMALLRDKFEDSPVFINWCGPVQKVEILVEEE